MSCALHAACAHCGMSLHLDDVHVVSHTHWDREWYHTAEHFRQRLVSLIDDLLDDPPPFGGSFLLDGQAILLDDYLAVRPERAAELGALLREGRIEAGPWYVLADELIPSGEALVRNLIAGRETLRRLRGEAPRVLYCPDSFGHPAALPDLACEFGCDVIVLWRGYGGRRWPAGDAVRWLGAAGNTAIVYHLPPDGYEFGGSLPLSPEQARERWQRVSAVLGARSGTGTAILLNGADHHARQRGLRAAIDLMAGAAAPTRVHASSLRDAARAVSDAARDHELPTIQGELRDSYGYSWTLQGTLGSRAAQKRRNACAERLLVRDVEPWIALSPAGGSRSTRALLAACWRTLLEAHPHDTLCGTSIDAVADAFDARLASVEEQGRALRWRALGALLAHDEDAARAQREEWKPMVVIRNPAARSRGGVAELTLRTKIADVAVGPGSASRQGKRHRVGAVRVQNVPLQIISRRERIELTEAQRAYPDADLVMEVRAVGWVEKMHGYSADTRPQSGQSREQIPNAVVATSRALDNGLVRIEVSESGAVSFEDRALGRYIHDLLAVERARDVGDLYTPAIRESLDVPYVRRVRLAHRGPIRGEITIEMAGSRGSTASRCDVTLRLDADDPLLHVIVAGVNRDRDQRLRMVFHTRLAAARTVADAAFRAVERHPLTIHESDAAIEHVVTTAPLHRWVARFDADAGAALISDGLAEYESLDDGRIAVTLVRSVGELSRADLPERMGHAGWPASTPRAQCTGRYDARFALRLLGADSPAVRAEIERCATDVLLPLTGETLRSNLGEPCRVGGLELVGEGLAFSAACPASRDGWIVLRCVNQLDVDVTGEWRLTRSISEAVRARLDETPRSSLGTDNGVVAFTAAPHEIITILVR